MKLTILLGVALLWPLASWAADDITPFDAKLGLWQTTSKVEIAGMPAMPAAPPQLPADALDKLPPDQRAQAEAAMKGRGNMGSGVTSTGKFCMTHDSLSKAMALSGNRGGDCTYKVNSSSASRQEIHMECTQPRVNMKMAGDLTVERVDAEHMKGSLVMKVEGSDRSPEFKTTFDSKWVAADCGDIKPLGDK